VDVQHTPDSLLVLWERDGRVECSRDLCKTWLAPTTRPSQSRDTWAQALAVDPRDPKHWIVATRSVREEWSKEDPDGGAFETTDAGATWTRLDAGAGVENGNQGIVAAIDAKGVAWYGADGGGLFRRAVADGPWDDVTPTAVPKPWWFNAFLVASAPGGGVEAVLQAESAGSEVRSLLRSTDDGKTWSAMESPEARLASLSVDPKVPGRYLAGDVSGDRGVLVYEREGAPPPAAPEGPSESAPPRAPTEGSSLPGPRRLLGVSVARDGSARLFDARSGRALATLAGPAGGVLSVATAPDGSAVFAGGADRTVVQWDASGVRVRAFAPQPGPVTALAVSPDGTTLYAGDAQWGIERLALVGEGPSSRGRIEGHAGAVLSLAVSPDGRRLFSGSADGTLRFWDAETGAPAGPPQPHDSEVYAVAVSGDGATVWTATRSPTVRAFDAATGEPRGTFDAGMPAVFALAPGPDGSVLAAGAGAGVVRFGGSEPVRLEGPGPVLALASSPDGVAVAGGADGAVRVFLAGETKATVSLPPHGAPVLGVAVAPLAGPAEPARPVEGPGPSGEAPPSPPPQEPDPAAGPQPGPPPAEPPPPSPPGPAPSNPPAMG
jgi:WD40 repeat protein